MCLKIVRNRRDAALMRLGRMETHWPGFRFYFPAIFWRSGNGDVLHQTAIFTISGYEHENPALALF